MTDGKVASMKSRQVVVVGAGLGGLRCADALRQQGIDFCILERERQVGGVWRWHANSNSQVNTTEPGYRVHIHTAGSANFDHTPTWQFLHDMDNAAAVLGERLCLRTTVKRVETLAESQGYVVHCEKDGVNFTINCQGVVVMVNRRLGKPRSICYPGEDVFRGAIKYGVGGDIDELNFKNKQVVIIGMGAFATENARTALERGAAKVTLLCRRHGVVSPKLVDYLKFVRPFTTDWQRCQNGTQRIMHEWANLYASTGATPPETWSQGKLAPDGHSVGVSDFWFIAHHYGLIETITGTVAQLEADTVITSSNARLPADVLIKCVGFEINDSVPSMVGASEMLGTGMIHDHLWYIAEPHNDIGDLPKEGSGIFSGNFVSNVNQACALFIHYLRNPARLKEIYASGSIPAVSVTTFKMSEIIHSWMTWLSQDAEAMLVLETVAKQLISDFWQRFSPLEYMAENHRQWQDVCSVLGKGCRDTPPPPSTPGKGL